jgi:hypothetical protein
VKKSITNEFGQEIPVDTVYELADRIRILTDAELDELWLKSGYICSEKEEPFKAISKFYADRIHSGVWCAISVVENLLLETRIENVKKNLEAIEKRSGYR